MAPALSLEDSGGAAEAVDAEASGASGLALRSARDSEAPKSLTNVGFAPLLPLLVVAEPSVPFGANAAVSAAESIGGGDRRLVDATPLRTRGERPPLNPTPTTPSAAPEGDSDGEEPVIGAGRSRPSDSRRESSGISFSCRSVMRFAGSFSSMPSMTSTHCSQLTSGMPYDSPASPLSKYSFLETASSRGGNCCSFPLLLLLGMNPFRTASSRRFLARSLRNWTITEGY